MASRQNARTFRTKRVPWPAPALVALLICLRSFAMCSAAAAAPGFAGPEGPGLVSLNGRDLPVEEAYARLSKAAGVSVRLDRGVTDASRRISFSVVSEPFWIALQRLNAKADMHVGKVMQDDGPAVTLYPASIVSNHRTVATAVDGAFLATLIDATFERGREKKVGPPIPIESSLTLQLQPDPRVKAMLLKDFKLDELIDESGRPLKSYTPSTPNAFDDCSAGPGIRIQAREAPRRVGRMKVSGRVMVATRWETVEVGNVGSDDPSTTSASGFRVLTRARTDADVRHVIVELTRTGGPDPLWFKDLNRIVLLRPTVFDRRNGALLTSMTRSDWFGKTFRFELDARQPSNDRSAPKVSDVDHLRFEIPSDAKFYDVHFEFRDLTLN
jgi:hypothetical protein